MTRLWIENLFLAGVFGLLLFLYVGPNAQSAHAAGGWDTDGIMALSTSGNARILLIDTKKKTMCIYRTFGAGELKLTGARSYQYDVEMKDTSKTKIGNQGITFVESKQIYDKYIANQ